MRDNSEGDDRVAAGRDRFSVPAECGEEAAMNQCLYPSPHRWSRCPHFIPRWTCVFTCVFGCMGPSITQHGEASPWLDRVLWSYGSFFFPSLSYLSSFFSSFHNIYTYYGSHMMSQTLVGAECALTGDKAARSC